MLRPISGFSERNHTTQNPIRLAIALVYISGRRLLILIIASTVVTSVAIAGQLLVGRTVLNLLAAEMAFKNARANKSKMDRQSYRKTLDKTRELYAQVLIADEANRKKLLPILANGSKWPSKAQWRWIAGKPGPLLTAAEVFGESSPRGLDGRWIAVRLIERLHKLTRPFAEPGTKEAEFVNTYWEGVQLKLELLLAIAESQSETNWAKTAARQGHSFAKNHMVTYEKMDGPERVKVVTGLEAQLRALK